MSYQSAMRRGLAQYEDVVEHLSLGGFKASFTQTGGMNAGLEIMLDGGFSVLITEADDSLAWARGEHRSWGATLFPPGQSYDSECIAADTTDDPSADALLRLVRELLSTAVAASPR